MSTQKKDASKASKQLPSKKSTMTQKSVADSDLTQAKRKAKREPVPNTHAFRNNIF